MQTTEASAASLSGFEDVEYTVPGTYYALAQIINDQRPYGRDEDVVLPDFGDQSLFEENAVPKAEPRADEPGTLTRRRDMIDVFGQLVLAKAPNRVEVTVDELGQVMIAEEDARIIKVEGAGHVVLPDDSEMPYTKGLRIPYKYLAKDGKTVVYANILVLYNGTGHI